jgi:hypothetical protein
MAISFSDLFWPDCTAVLQRRAVTVDSPAMLTLKDPKFVRQGLKPTFKATTCAEIS